MLLFVLSGEALLAFSERLRFLSSSKQRRKDDALTFRNENELLKSVALIRYIQISWPPPSAIIVCSSRLWNMRNCIARLTSSSLVTTNKPLSSPWKRRRSTGRIESDRALSPSRMDSIGVKRDEGLVSFATLFGMCDYLTFPLGNSFRCFLELRLFSVPLSSCSRLWCL